MQTQSWWETIRSAEATLDAIEVENPSTACEACDAADDRADLCAEHSLLVVELL
jgi:hypothetical protein